VRGIVVDATGRPVDNASVMLMSDPSMGVSAMMAGGPGRARTSADGQFRFDGVAAGVYFARAAAPLVAKSNTSPGVQGGTISGVVGPITGGISAGVSGGIVGGGIGFSTESHTADGVTTTYRFDQSGEVRVTVLNADVIDLQLVATRPQP
jgi:hypothetical protein